jgi:ABC-type multidrug transport system fused ATPase/permease subunit
MTANAISENVSLGIRKMFDACGALGLMLWLSPHLTITSLAVMPVFFFSSFFGRWAKKQTQMQLSRLSESSHIAEERLIGIRTVRAFATEEREEKRYLEKLNELYATAIRLAFGTAGIYGATNLALNTSFLVVLFRGTHLVEAGSMSVG